MEGEDHCCAQRFGDCGIQGGEEGGEVRGVEVWRAYRCGGGGEGESEGGGDGGVSGGEEDGKQEGCWSVGIVSLRFLLLCRRRNFGGGLGGMVKMKARSSNVRGSPSSSPPVMEAGRSSLIRMLYEDSEMSVSSSGKMEASTSRSSCCSSRWDILPSSDLLWNGATIWWWDRSGKCAGKRF